MMCNADPHLMPLIPHASPQPGTGNQTPHVSSAVIARVFLDPELRLFDYDPERLLSQTPAMLTFEPLRDIYAAAVRKTNATFHFQRALVQVERRRFFHRRSRWERDIRAQDDAGKWEYFDEVRLVELAKPSADPDLRPTCLPPP